jgi:ADP-ribose pyrophosphatase
MFCGAKSAEEDAALKRQIEILSTSEVFRKAIFRIEEARLRVQRFDGTMSDEMTRLNLERGDSVAAILHDPQADTVLITEQFRYPTYAKTGGWIMEIPAGSVDPGETPEDTVRREMVEETGYRLNRLVHLSTFYLSPGGTSERIFLYYVSITPTDQIGAGGGLAHEGEDIRIWKLKVSDALAKMEAGEINDAKTIIGLQWLQLNRGRVTRRG